MKKTKILFAIWAIIVVIIIALLTALGFILDNRYEKYRTLEEKLETSAREYAMDNVLLNNDKIVIIHGIGTGIVKNSVHEALMKNRYVEKYQLDNFNTGCTIVWLKKNQGI